MKNLPKILSLGLTATALTLLSSPYASAQTWDGGGGDNNWTTGDNWNGNVAPVANASLIFAGSTRTNAVNDFTAGTVFNLIRFDGAASAFNLSGNRIGLGAANDVSGNIRWDGTPGVITQTISADLDLSVGGTGTRSFNVAPDATLLLSGTISGSGAWSKLGLGTLSLTGSNSVTGIVFLQTGTVQISSIGNAGVNSAFGAGDSFRVGTAANTATISLAGSSSAQSSNRQVIVGTGAGASTGGATIRNDNTSSANSLTFTNATFNVAQGTGNANTARTITLGGSNTGNNTIEGSIINNNATTGTIAVTKADAGKWILGGASTYTGGTTINAGTLLVNNVSGSGTGTAAVTLNAATLGGTGTISGLVTTNGTTSVISPGNSPGTLNLTGGLNAAAGATFTFELGTTSDSLNLGSGVFTGSTAAGGLLFDFSNSGGLAFSTPYTLITFGSSPSLDYTDLVANTLPSGVTLDTSFGTGGWQINSGSLQVQLIPEPSSALLLLAGLGALALRRRYQKA